MTPGKPPRRAHGATWCADYSLFILHTSYERFAAGEPGWTGAPSPACRFIERRHIQNAMDTEWPEGIDILGKIAEHKYGLDLDGDETPRGDDVGDVPQLDGAVTEQLDALNTRIFTLDRKVSELLHKLSKKANTRGNDVET